MGSPAGTCTFPEHRRRWARCCPCARAAATSRLTALGIDTAQAVRSSARLRPPAGALLRGDRRSASSTPSSIARTSGGAQRVGYSSLEQFFDSTLNCLRAHPAAQLHLRLLRRLRLDRARARRRQPDRRDCCCSASTTAFCAFLCAAAGLDATVIVTADHGFIDSPRGRVIELDRPSAPAEAMLRLPLCGERRAAYCYVHPDTAHEFERLRAPRACRSRRWLYRSETLIEEGWFGPGEPHPRA